MIAHIDPVLDRPAVKKVGNYWTVGTKRSGGALMSCQRWTDAVDAASHWADLLAQAQRDIAAADGAS